MTNAQHTEAFDWLTGEWDRSLFGPWFYVSDMGKESHQVFVPRDFAMWVAGTFWFEGRTRPAHDVTASYGPRGRMIVSNPVIITVAEAQDRFGRDMFYVIDPAYDVCIDAFAVERDHPDSLWVYVPYPVLGSTRPPGTPLTSPTKRSN